MDSVQTAAQRITRAQQMAETFAKPLTDAGWTVEYSIRHEDPTMYPSDPDEVMLDGRTLVSFSAKKEWFSGLLGAGWCTYDGAGRGRGTTKFLGGYYYPFAGKRRALGTYGQLASWIGVVK
jgi:hypothetical protein